MDSSAFSLCKIRSYGDLLTMICSLVSSSAQYQSDEGEQFEMEPMDTEFEESSLNRCVLQVIIIIFLLLSVFNKKESFFKIVRSSCSLL